MIENLFGKSPPPNPPTPPIPLLSLPPLLPLTQEWEEEPRHPHTLLARPCKFQTLASYEYITSTCACEHKHF